MKSTPKPTLRCIKIANIIADDKYQRALRKWRVNGIAAKFDFRALGIPAVSEREGGMFAVVDGHHRVIAAQEAGYDAVWCEVIDTETVQDEAETFGIRNQNRGPLKALELFRSKITANDPSATAILKAVRSVGFDISYTTRSKELEWGMFQCIGAFERVWQYGQDELTNALRLISDSFDGQVEACRDRVFLGVWRFARNYAGVYDRQRLVKVLADSSVSKISKRCRTYIEMFGGAAEINFARAILEVYNKNLKSGRLPKCRLYREGE